MLKISSHNITLKGREGGQSGKKYFGKKMRMQRFSILGAENSDQSLLLFPQIDTFSRVEINLDNQDENG